MTNTVDALPPLVLRSAEFRRAREATWRTLEEMVGRVEKHGIGALSAEELQALPLLYRATISSLSVARSIALDRNLLRYMESLSLRAYLVVYGPREGLLETLGRFFLHGFPALVRRARRPIALATFALLLGVAAGYLLVAGDEQWFHSIVPEDLAGGRGPASSARDLLDDQIFAPWPGFVDAFVVFANALFQHNTLVGITAFGLGIAAGVPTFLLLVYQGVVIGAFVALHANRGIALDFVGWMSIHGVTELTAIVLCGAAGLMIGGKVLFPGQGGRLDNLARDGRAAAGLAAGAVVLFLVAGLIEGGLRQLVASTSGRFAIAALTGVLWLAYFLSGRRRAGDAA